MALHVEVPPIPDRVSLLADVAEIVSRSHDLQETLANVIDLVGKRLDADVCSIYLTEPDLRTLTLSATIGLDPECVGQVQLAFGEGLVGAAAERRETVAIETALDDPRSRYFPETGEERYASLLAAPLIVQGVTIGVLVIQTLESRRFDPQDIGLLQTCAQLLAPVVINARLIALAASPAGERTRPEADSGGRSGTLELRGIPTMRGVAIGPVYRLEDPIDLARLDYEPSSDPAREKEDLISALADARREIDELREQVGERFGPEFAAVFYTQMQIVEDHGFVTKLEQQVEESGDALAAVRAVVDHYRKTFERIQDPYFRERGADIEDVGRRVMEKLLGVRHQSDPMQPGSVVVADQILPTLFARLEVERVAAIVAEHGGPTSHGAIFARTLEIPAITGVSALLTHAQPGELAVVDGGEGRVYLDPDAGLVAEYERAQAQYHVAIEHLDALRERPAESRDGRRIRLTANVGLLADLRLVEQHGAEGVGLFRTELLALAHRGFPSEEEQQQLYTKVCTDMAPRTVTIRTLDLGGDKGIPNVGFPDEDNPQLGLRSIRLTLENQRAFRTQLRAILRASQSGNVRLLLPMISGIGELRDTRVLIDRVRNELVRDGVPFQADLPVGLMIEVPSAALVAEALAAECDFFSIGTNDLTQYTLAVDRGNERVAHLYNPLHPAVLTLIDHSARAAQRAGIPISLCGEMATNPLAVPILLGLGIEELSGAPAAVPVVREIVRALDFGKAEKAARQALTVATADEVHAISAELLRASGLLDHPDIGDWLRSSLDAGKR
ncbi:MAG: phosphoenolpyruvate--protein phosphotransferase [Proteobacteria bacterium]|nr:phosphoenolpyruvate--protein phosphotransferase [Pseudomonadota bacterium]